MGVLLGVGFLGGLITGISPCILPVVPVILAGSATGVSRRRPYAIIAGLVLSFSVFTLVGGSLLSFLHLPQDTLRDAGLAALFLLAIALIVPKVGEVLERPFARLSFARPSGSGSGFVLGISLGLVFVPCAGPVLAAISIVAATHHVGLTSLFLTLAYALGAAVPLLAFALLSRRTIASSLALRSKAPLVRRVSGVVVGLTALAIAFNITRPLQTSVPGYASALEAHVESGGSVTTQLQNLTGEHANKFAIASKSSSLPIIGKAPNFTGIVSWLNTPGNRPLTLSQLRGKVVLVDFWTYSCINCIRTLPHVEAWYNNYKNDGFVVIGVQTPEFAFEHVVSNVSSAAAQLGVKYPIAVDNNYGTWDAYNNEYWPAEYLVDKNGDVRHTDFGEGSYSTTESDIRSLLEQAGHTHLPKATDVADKTPTEGTTPETYLGYSRLQDYVGSPVYDNIAAPYQAPSQIPENGIAFSGIWTIGEQGAAAGRGAAIHLTFTAKDVYLVLGGHGSIDVLVNNKPVRSIDVKGIPRLYTMVSTAQAQQGDLELRVGSGVTAYDFTFG